nr:MAG TPA: hypothetical protein [Caudoviricetes sp.]
MDNAELSFDYNKLMFCIYKVVEYCYYTTRYIMVIGAAL